MSGRIEGNLVYVSDFDDRLEDELCLDFVKLIDEESVKADGRIDIFINSYGGLADVAFHLIELVGYAKSRDIVVRTIVTSAAYSAGSILAVTGTPGERYIAKHAHHLVHYGMDGAVVSTPKQTQRSMTKTQAFFNQMYEIYDTHCEIPDLKEQMSDDSFYINAKKAIQWKMADKPFSKFILRP